ncbi:MAG: hypothetical protein J6J23_03115, partial [Clostridia bacterium]|nr:hypothetical protein [Clostridia bacterium]
MEDKIVNVLVNEDKSVDRLLKRTSKKLKKSFNKSSRSLNELKLNQKKSFWAKALSIMLNAISVSFIIITTFICVLGIINKSKGIPPTFAGLAEAEAYPGPSLIIGYAPCEMHSIKGGMAN